MPCWETSAKALIFGTFLSLSTQLVVNSAQAIEPQSHRNDTAGTATGRTNGYQVAHGVLHAKRATHARFAAHGGISCVPFARNDSGIAVAGNAWQWWDNAAGVYARGSVPEPGSVLTFRSNGRMRLGHVAVVSRVINPRQIEIEHANWWGPGAYGGVARNIPVVDVSEANDWTAVRVGLGQSAEYGSVYPTYGFIYDRPDTGVMMAAKGVPAPQPELNPAPSDLRPAAERGWQTYEEVAEMPVPLKHHRRGAVHLTSRRAHQVALADRRQ